MSKREYSGSGSGLIQEVLAGIGIDPNVLQPAVETWAGFMTNLAKWAASIDWKAFSDGRWHKHLILSVAEEVSERADTSEHDRRKLQDHAKAFELAINQIIKSSRQRDKQAALDAMTHASMIIALSGISHEALAEIKRQQTKAATKKRKTLEFNAIVGVEAKQFWDKLKSYRGKWHYTGGKICDKVMERAVASECVAAQLLDRLDDCLDNKDAEKIVTKWIARRCKAIGSSYVPPEQHD
jgi:hypothetical protein